MNWDDDQKDELKAWMKELPQEQLPDSFTHNLMAQIAQEAVPVPARVWPSLFPKWLALGLAAILGSLLAWSYLSPSNSTSSSAGLQSLEKGLEVVDGAMSNFQLPTLLLMAAAALLAIFALDAWLARRSLR